MTSLTTPTRTLSLGYTRPDPLPWVPAPSPLSSPEQIYAYAWARTQAQLSWEQATRAYWRAVALSN